MRYLYWDDMNECICAKVAEYDKGWVMLYADGETGHGGSDWYEFFARDEKPLTLESIAEATEEYKELREQERQEALDDAKLAELEPDTYEEDYFMRHGGIYV